MTAPSATRAAAPSDAELLAADAVGDFIEHWGFRKALGRIWTVLYLAGEALPADELCRRLTMSTGAVSMTLAELQRWGVVHRVPRPGERKVFFAAETDFWKMISRVLAERERHLALSIRERLEQARGLLDGAGASRETETRKERLRRLLQLATVGETVLETFLASRRVDFTGFLDVLSRVRPLRAR